MKPLKITLVACILALTTNAQTVRTVDNRPQSGAQYTTIQAAVDAAVAGDIIQIHPSSKVYGNVIINKQLSLVGLGHDPITHDQGITAKMGQIRFQGVSANSVVKGLTISSIYIFTATNANNIHIINNKIITVINNNLSTGVSDNWIIEGNYFASVSTPITISANGTLIKNNFVHGGVSRLNASCLVTNNIFFSTSTSTFQTFFSYCDGTIISNNIFVSNKNITEFRILSSSNLNFSNNLTYSYNGKTIIALPGLNNLDNTNPNFISVPAGTEDAFYSNDYHLAPGSLGVNYGTDGTDIGIYGNNFLFDTHGRPDLMPYPISITINNNVLAAGQNLSVNFTAAQKQ